MIKFIFNLDNGVDQDFFEKFVLTLRKHKVVKLGKLGTFRIQKLKARKAIDIHTKKEIIIPSQNTVKFKPSETLKRLMQDNQKRK